MSPERVLIAEGALFIVLSSAEKNYPGVTVDLVDTRLVVTFDFLKSPYEITLRPMQPEITDAPRRGKCETCGKVRVLSTDGMCAPCADLEL